MHRQTPNGKNVLRTKRPTDKTSYDKTFHVDNSVRPTTKHPTQDKKRTIFAFRSKFELYGIKIPYFCVSSLANFFVLTYVDKALAAIKRTLSREKLGVFDIRDVALGLNNGRRTFFKIYSKPGLSLFVQYSQSDLPPLRDSNPEWADLMTGTLTTRPPLSSIQSLSQY